MSKIDILVKDGNLYNEILGYKLRSEFVSKFIEDHQMDTHFSSCIMNNVFRIKNELEFRASLEFDVVNFYKNKREELMLQSFKGEFREIFMQAHGDPKAYLKLVLPQIYFRREILEEYFTNKCWTPELMRLEFSQTFSILKQAQHLQQLISELESRQIELPKKLVPIKWLGKQQELAELFVELERKGWIEITSKKTIQLLFEPSASVLRMLAPGQSRGIYDKPYPYIYKPRYIKKFDLIRQR